jgi:hypothetical protein
MSAAGMCLCMHAAIKLIAVFYSLAQVKKFRAHYRLMRVYYYNQIYTLFSIQTHQGHAFELILMRYLIRIGQKSVKNGKYRAALFSLRHTHKRLVHNILLLHSCRWFHLRGIEQKTSIHFLPVHLYIRKNVINYIACPYSLSTKCQNSNILKIPGVERRRYERLARKLKLHKTITLEKFTQ